MSSIVEQWRPVAGFEGLYEVSDHGRVRSLDHDVKNSRGSGSRKVIGRILKPKKGGNNPYLQVTLSNGKHYYRAIAHLVLEAFAGPRPEGSQAAHNDGNPVNNHLNNLRWASPVENASDKKLHGTHLKGETVPFARLTDKEVIEIRLAYRIWGPRNSNRLELAAQYNVDCMTISNIVWGKSWKHLDPPAAPAHLERKAFNGHHQNPQVHRAPGVSEASEDLRRRYLPG